MSTESPKLAYWENYFAQRKGKVYEFYGDYGTLRGAVREALGALASPNPTILMAGCGNSEISAEMYDDGFENITNIDFSKFCIEEMLRKHSKKRPHMKWLEMDMTKTSFPEASFDVVFDKAGLYSLMDEKLCGIKFLAEVRRLTKLGGIYICVTLMTQDLIGLIFRVFRANWEVSFAVLPVDKNEHGQPIQPFLIIAKKTESGVAQIAGFDHKEYADRSTGQLLEAVAGMLIGENKERLEKGK